MRHTLGVRHALRSIRRKNGRIHSGNGRVFVFCSRGPGPSDPGGGDPLTERSKPLRPVGRLIVPQVASHREKTADTRALGTEIVLTLPSQPISILQREIGSNCSR